MQRQELSPSITWAHNSQCDGHDLLLSAWPPQIQEIPSAGHGHRKTWHEKTHPWVPSKGSKQCKRLHALTSLSNNPFSLLHKLNSEQAVSSGCTCQNNVRNIKTHSYGCWKAGQHKASAPRRYSTSSVCFKIDLALVSCTEMPLASPLLEKETLSLCISILFYLVNSLKWSKCRNYFYRHLYLISLEFDGTPWRCFPSCLPYRYPKPVVKCSAKDQLFPHGLTPGSVMRTLSSPMSHCSDAFEQPWPCCIDAQNQFTCHKHQVQGWAKATLIHFGILVFYQCSLASLWAFGFILHQTTQHCHGAGYQMCSIYFYSLIACDRSSQTEPSWTARTTLPAPLCAQADHISDCLEVTSETSWWRHSASGPGV